MKGSRTGREDDTAGADPRGAPRAFDHLRLQSIATSAYLLAYTIPLAIMTTLAFLRGDQLIVLVLGTLTIIAGAIHLHVYRNGVGPVVRVVLVTVAAALFIYLVTTGGYEGTGLLWCFAVFVMIFHFSPAVPGLILNLLLMAAAGLLLLTPGLAGTHPEYGEAMVSRFLIAGTLTCVLIFVYALMQQTLTERLKETQELLYRASMTDELTGLVNRRSMKDTLHREDMRRRGEERILAIAIGDVDHFKTINDSLGHDAGDQILRHIAHVMRSTLRDTDLVARWGGEEFLLLLDVVDHNEAVDVVERVRRTLEDTPASYDGSTVQVSGSFGIRVVVDPAERLPDAVIEADKNLIRAKELGRNRVVAS